MPTLTENNKITLYQLNRSGKFKILKIWTEDNKIMREHGLENGKMQIPAPREVKGKNIGKSNETSPSEQALKEANAIIVKKLEEGYNATKVSLTAVPQTLNIYDLPKEFAPSKPVNKVPSRILKDLSHIDWQRKYNGVNLLITKKTIYTRRMDKITDILKNIPEIEAIKKYIPDGALVSVELIYADKIGKEVPKYLKGLTNAKTTNEKALKRYKDLKKLGWTLSIKGFDILFKNHKSVCEQNYNIRKLELFSILPDTYKPEEGKGITSITIQNAKDNDWEGFVLREEDKETSHVEFTLNGKPYRRGAWKYKFEYEDDYFITKVIYGNSGRLKGLPAKFLLCKKDKIEIVECCWAGPGNISTEELPDFAANIGVPANMPPETQMDARYTCVEVKYQSKQYESVALEFPVIRRLRLDKKPRECQITDVPNTIIPT